MRLDSIKPDKRPYIARKVREKFDAHIGKQRRWRTFDGEWIGWGSKNLSGLCAIASFALAKSFEFAGYSAKVIRGIDKQDYHCWVISGDNIYDITATQFGRSYPKVFITKKDSPKAWGFPNTTEVGTKSFSHWPEEQRPNRDRSNLFAHRLRQSSDPSCTKK